jgi:hypothetical protein
LKKLNAVICIFIKPTKKENTMSIETDLNRIATSMEEIVKALRASHTNTPAVPQENAPVATLGGKKGKNPTPQSAPAVTIDEITGQAMPAAQAQAAAPQPTLDEVHVQLRLLKDSQKATGGIDACKKIMIEFGADKARPVISSIPPANYAALIAKIGTLL